MNIPPYANGLSQLKRVAESLESGDSPPTVTLRQLLEWFGQQRRGWRVVATVTGALRSTGLATEPDFATAYIDGQLTFLLRDDEDALPQPGGDHDPKDLKDVNRNTTGSRTSEAFIGDPVLRVRMLPAAIPGAGNGEPGRPGGQGPEPHGDARLFSVARYTRHAQRGWHDQLALDSAGTNQRRGIHTCREMHGET